MAPDSLDLSRTTELDTILRRIMDEVRRKLHADRGTLYLVDYARRELLSRVADLPEIREIRLAMGEGAAGLAASTGRSISIPGDIDDARVQRRVDELTGYITRNMLVVPVLHQGVVVAVMQLLNKDQGDFTAADRKILEELGDGIGGLLARTSLGSQLHPDSAQPLSFEFNHIVGDSAVMQAVYERTRRAAATDATVLVRGRSGSGKELIARAIHDNSARVDLPFVKVDCAALPATLVENELFGHERGAFTGATTATDGKVRAAEGGTLFLDEVGELPLEVQGKLLRLLQDRTWLKVGGTTLQRGDVRFVCATNVELEDAVAAGTFRQDLYYRLRVVEIRLPSLASRGGGDLDRLIDHFLYRFCKHHRRPGLRLSPEARQALHAHDWPGNVRELEHCIESSVVLTPTEVIGSEQLALQPARQAGFTGPVRTLAQLEAEYVRHVLGLCNGNQSEAARVLGIGRNTLARKLR
jgi:Nif-specific regulatory protein